MNKFTKLLNSFSDGSFKTRINKYFNNFRHVYYLKDENIKRSEINYLNYQKLKKEYGHVLSYTIEDKPRKLGDKVFTCWMQGMDNAPELCKLGYSRMAQIFGKENVVVITADNYSDYVTLPDYIIDKWQKGIISNTHISDIIRYYLLYNHGGTWIDATVLLLTDDLPLYMFNSKLFVFADYISGAIPNYQSSFITAHSHSKLIGCTINLIEEYWKKENFTMDYNMYHYFFQMAEEQYQDEWKQMPKYPNHATHILRKVLFEPYSEEQFNQIKEMCPVQKLSHHKKPDDTKGTFYDVLIRNGMDYFNIIF